MPRATLPPLAGLPILVHDLLHVGGMPTRFGSTAFAADPPAPADDSLVQALRAAGAVVLGKGNVPAFGAGAACVNDLHGADTGRRRRCCRRRGVRGLRNDWRRPCRQPPRTCRLLRPGRAAPDQRPCAAAWQAACVRRPQRHWPAGAQCRRCRVAAGCDGGLRAGGSARTWPTGATFRSGGAGPGPAAPPRLLRGFQPRTGPSRGGGDRRRRHRALRCGRHACPCGCTGSFGRARCLRHGARPVVRDRNAPGARGTRWGAAAFGRREPRAGRAPFAG